MVEGMEDGWAEMRKEKMLLSAQKRIDQASSVIPEVERFLEELRGRVKLPALTGLPSFLRALDRDRQALQLLMKNIVEAASSNESLSKIDSKLEPCAVSLFKSIQHWDILKRCNSLVAMNQSFQGTSKETRRKEVSSLATSMSGKEKQLLHKTLKDQAKVEVDVVEGGNEWLDIRPIQQDRLVRQMTESGWDWGAHVPGDIVDPDEWSDTLLAKQVKKLVKAAKMNRQNYEIPRLRIVMPNLDDGNTDIACLLEQFRLLDPEVTVTIHLCNGAFLSTPAPPLELAIENLIVDEMAMLTETINMDHTVLVDMISDLTHCKLEPQPWQASTTRSQIIEEKEHGGLMVKVLYPLLQGRKLVCTKEMAEHFHDMLRTVGTKSERERGQLLVPLHGKTRAMSHEAIRRKFEELSIHKLPQEIQIPVQILHDEDWGPEAVERAVVQGKLPRVALDVARCGGFKSSKLSIYMYGWATGRTTVTSNKEIRGQIRTWVETNRHTNDERGPPIWRIDVTRNLLAKSATPPDRFGKADQHEMATTKDDKETRLVQETSKSYS